MQTRRRTLERTIGVTLLVLLLVVPVFREHRQIITTLGFAALVAVAIVRGKPEGVRFLFLSVGAAFAGVFLVVLAIAAMS